MSITPLKRLTLYGIVDQKGRVLEGLQELGCLHLVRLRPAADRHEEAPSPLPRDTWEALRYLQNGPLKRRPVSDDESFDSASVVERSLRNRKRLRQARDRLDELRHQLREVEPWGDFQVPPPEELGGLHLEFRVVPLRELRRLQGSALTWQVVNRDHRHAYVVVIREDGEPPESPPGQRVELGILSRSELRRQEERTIAEIEDAEAERWSLTRWIDLLRRDLARAENRAALEFAATQTLDATDVFAVQGWVPRDRCDRVRRFADEHGLASTLAEPDPDDTPPVLLANHRSLAAGEDLVSFFQLPGYRDWDPSAVVFVSFALFFAMILADAGYAALLGLVLAFSWRRMGRSDTGTRLRRLATVVVLAALGYGMLVGSYFGVAPASGSRLGDVKLLDVNDFPTMMRVSVVVGAAHVVLANAMAAWNRRRSWTALAPVGWIVAVTGALLMLLGGSGPAFRAAGGWALGAGGLAVVAFSSDRRVRTSRDVLWRVLDGLRATTGVTAAVGDVLSYLRLFALGLSSASLAITFNGLAQEAVTAAPGIGLLFGLGILVLGHVLNLILAIMSGVVHGLRLNLIEFYRWGIAGEGRPFRAFRKKEAVTWIP